MLGQFGQGFGGRFGRRRGWGKSSYYGSPAGQQHARRKIAHKKRKIEKLKREVQNLERELKPTPPVLIPTLRPPRPPAPKPPVLRPTAPPVPKAPPKPVGPTEAQKDARYLARYADIAKAVKSGMYKTGRQHWKRHGKGEGRVFDGLRPGFLAGFGGWWNK